MKGDGVDSDLEAFVDIAHTLKYNKEAFLKAVIQTLQPSVPKGKVTYYFPQEVI